VHCFPNNIRARGRQEGADHGREHGLVPSGRCPSMSKREQGVVQVPAIRPARCWKRTKRSSSRTAPGPPQGHPRRSYPHRSPNSRRRDDLSYKNNNTIVEITVNEGQSDLFVNFVRQPGPWDRLLEGLTQAIRSRPNLYKYQVLSIADTRASSERILCVPTHDSPSPFSLHQDSGVRSRPVNRCHVRSLAPKPPVRRPRRISRTLPATPPSLSKCRGCPFLSSAACRSWSSSCSARFASSWA
jgi:hypothetical protein